MKFPLYAFSGLFSFLPLRSKYSPKNHFSTTPLGNQVLHLYKITGKLTIIHALFSP